MAAPASTRQLSLRLLTVGARARRLAERTHRGCERAPPPPLHRSRSGCCRAHQHRRLQKSVRRSIAGRPSHRGRARACELDRHLGSHPLLGPLRMRPLRMGPLRMRHPRLEPVNFHPVERCAASVAGPRHCYRCRALQAQSPASPPEPAVPTLMTGHPCASAPGPRASATCRPLRWRRAYVLMAHQP